MTVVETKANITPRQSNTHIEIDFTSRDAMTYSIWWSWKNLLPDATSVIFASYKQKRKPTTYNPQAWSEV